MTKETQQINYVKDLQKKTEEIDPGDLTADNRLNHDLFKNTLDNHIRMDEFNTRYIPLNQMSGPHLDMPQIIEFHPFHTRQDIDNYVARLNAFPKLIDQVIGQGKKEILVNYPGSGRSYSHHEYNCQSHTYCRFGFLRHSQEGAQTQEFRQYDVVYQYCA